MTVRAEGSGSGQESVDTAQAAESEGTEEEILDECPAGQSGGEVQEYGELLEISEKSAESESIALLRKEQKEAEEAIRKVQEVERSAAKRLDKETHEKTSIVSSIEDFDDAWSVISVGNMEGNIRTAGADTAETDPVKVAILDSGVDYTSDIDVYLRKNFIPGQDEVSVIYEDISGHGTSVAGIIAAKDNDDGITGINPNVQLYSARILDENKQAPASRVVAAIDWAIEQDVDIINISFGTTVDSEEIHAAIKRAYDAGILIVAAAGNNGVVEYPAAYDEVIAVGAVDAAGNRAEGSAIGDELELVAPGQQIVSTGAFGGLCVVGGTSLAAPHVTAVASVLWQIDKSVSADFIRSLLAFTANQYGEDYEYGNGLVDLDFALSQYEAFKEAYVADDNDALNEQVRAAIEDGTLEVNEKPVLEFTDVTYVEGSWKQPTHEEFATVDSIESGNPLSTSGIAVVKLGANKTDHYFYHMSYYPELHGFTSRQPEGVFEYFSNYVYSYIYLTEIASAVYNGISPLEAPHTVTATCISSCKNHAAGWCVAKSAAHINSCFDGANGLNNGETGASVNHGESWDQVLKDVGNTARNRGLFIYGMALHTITDLFAHSTYRTDTGAFIVHPAADSIEETKNRYACANLVSQYVISHIKRQRAGSISDFYNVASSSVYDASFKLGRLDQYIKAVDPAYYSAHKDVFDAMTHPR